MSRLSGWEAASRALRPLAAAVLVLSNVGSAQAELIPVPLDGVVNADLRQYSGGPNYPVAPTALDVGGVPFQLVPLPGALNSLGAVQTPADPSVFSIPVNVPAAVRVFTLINSAFGTLGADNGAVEFTGSGGAFASFDLVQGFNIRDHFNSGFNNVVSDPLIVPQEFGGGAVRLDRQTFELPAAFLSQTLVEVRLVGDGPGFGPGQPFLAAVTVETVPAPAGWVLWVVAQAAVCLWGRRLGSPGV